MIRLAIALAGAAVLVGAGFAGGHKVAGLQEAKRVELCAEGIRQANTEACPKRIIDAFAHLQTRALQETIVYRDRTIPVIIAGASAERAANTAVLAAIEALNNEERTNACATSPAVAARRLQLCDTEGGADCAEPSAGEVPR